MSRTTSLVAGAFLAAAATASLCIVGVPVMAQVSESPLALQQSQSAAAVDGEAYKNADSVDVAPELNSHRHGSTPSPAESRKFSAERAAKVPKHRTPIARRVAEMLDANISVQLETSLDSLADTLSEQLSIPVMTDNRAIETAKLDPAQTVITLASDDQPLRSALHKSLQPLGLRADVQDEGLVITADFTELTRRGILADKWVGLSDEFNARVEKVLTTEVELPQEQVPLNRVVAELSRAVDFPMHIERVALEAIGLTEDVPVGGYSPREASEQRKGWDGRLFSAESEGGPDQAVSPAEVQPAEDGKSSGIASEKEVPVQKLPLGTALHFLLNDLELTFTVRDGMVVVTTRDSEETRLLTRLYFSEGTGLPRGDLVSAISMIQHTIEPDTWEILGGVSTMVPVGNGERSRPALLVSTTFDVHQQIADLMKSLRESHFGPDPISSGPPPLPAVPQSLQNFQFMGPCKI